MCVCGCGCALALNVVSGVLRRVLEGLGLGLGGVVREKKRVGGLGVCLGGSLWRDGSECWSRF